MPRIKIMPDNTDKSKPKFIPTSEDLSRTVPRWKPAGGKPPLPLNRSYNTQVTR